MGDIFEVFWEVFGGHFISILGCHLGVIFNGTLDCILYPVRLMVMMRGGGFDLGYAEDKERFSRGDFSRGENLVE